MGRDADSVLPSYEMYSLVTLVPYEHVVMCRFRFNPLMYVTMSTHTCITRATA